MFGSKLHSHDGGRTYHGFHEHWAHEADPQGRHDHTAGAKVVTRVQPEGAIQDCWGRRVA